MLTDDSEHSNHDPKPIADLLEQPGIARLTEKAQQLHRLDDLLQKALPKELAHHCQVMNQQGNTLIIVVDSAAWMMPLRLQEAKLLQQLQSQPIKIDKIEYKVRPTLT